MRGIMFNEHFGLESAVLEGRKTQTRRIIKCPTKIKGQDVYSFCIAKNNHGEVTEVFCIDFNESPIEGGTILPPYQVGEVVAIKQSYYQVRHENDIDVDLGLFKPWADLEDYDTLLESAGWGNKMFVKNDLMPHHVKINSIRVERLQDISHGDCLKEGVIDTSLSYCVQGIKGIAGHQVSVLSPAITLDCVMDFDTPQQAFASLIDKVHDKGTWESNPYVWVYDFELISQ